MRIGIDPVEARASGRIEPLQKAFMSTDRFERLEWDGSNGR